MNTAGGRRHDVYPGPTVARACVLPSRYGLLTGRYSWRLRTDGVLNSGIVGNYGNSISGKASSPATILEKPGYDTAAFGKWHLGCQLYDQQGNKFGWQFHYHHQPRHKSIYRAGLKDMRLTSALNSFFGMVATINQPPYAYLVNDRVLL